MERMPPPAPARAWATLSFCGRGALADMAFEVVERVGLGGLGSLVGRWWWLLLLLKCGALRRIDWRATMRDQSEVAKRRAQRYIGEDIISYIGGLAIIRLMRNHPWRDASRGSVWMKVEAGQDGLGCCHGTRWRSSAAEVRWNEVMPPPWAPASALKLGGIACDSGGVFRGTLGDADESSKIKWPMPRLVLDWGWWGSH